nr:glycosyltransferase [Helleborus thibetanus]
MANHTVVLYPSPTIGHLISMIELGKFILKHYPTLSITVLITTPPFNTGSTAPYINHVSKTIPLINIHHLPIVSLPPTSSSHMETFELLNLNIPLVCQALHTISQTSIIQSLIIDTFCTSALDIAINLNIPTYYFFTSGVSALAHLLYFPTFAKTNFKSLQDRGTYLHFPGLPRISVSDMPKPMLGTTGKVYDFILNVATSLPKSSGIIVNSFESLEPQALEAISDGICVLDAPTPPIYCIGPLIADADRSDTGKAHECLNWLDLQPSRTVVFLCFGSLGLFSEAQLKEIATGLENSGLRFLWVVRTPPTDNETKRFIAPAEPNLDALLPAGFLDRTRDRGLVVKSWAPQVEVLSHESVGGFVTHCGWNSVLEAICVGVPMVAWPLYAEQRLNKVVMVEEMKIALKLEESEEGFVCANELEKRVRQLMDSDEGKIIREQTAKMSKEANAAMGVGGSSLNALSALATSWT